MSSSRFRSFMKTELDLIETNNESLCITTARKGKPQQMVIISKELYDQSNVAECVKELNNGD